MKILIILPNWLGDAIMATPAIELLAKHYPQAKFTFVGSYVSIEALKHHPQCEKAYVDETKKAKSRLLATYSFAHSLGNFDLAITFRKNLFASLLLYFTKTPIRIGRHTWFNRLLLTITNHFTPRTHLVKNYASLVQRITGSDTPLTPLKLYVGPKSFERPTLGINPGATYGSAKRWYPEKFAQVVQAFNDRFDIIIFGGPTEVDMGDAIAKDLQKLGVTNFTNLAGKTGVQELLAYIGGCDLFITNDSGPMHVAAAYHVPTVAIFGPTKDTETSQWMNEKSAIVKLGLECAPCMKRSCPLKHHDCMKNITPQMVIDAAEALITP